MSQVMNEVAPAEHPDIEEINCLFVPLSEGALLVPMSAVAEVIQTVEVSTQENAPVWFNGWLEWRQKRVPLISFEALRNETRQGISSSSSALVMNTLSPEKGLSYYAIQAQDFSHLMRIAEDDPLQQVDGQGDIPHVLMHVELDGQIMQIPDLESLESYLVRGLQDYVKSAP